MASASVGAIQAVGKRAKHTGALSIKSHAAHQISGRERQALCVLAPAAKASHVQPPADAAGEGVV